MLSWLQLTQVLYLFICIFLFFLRDLRFLKLPNSSIPYVKNEQSDLFKFHFWCISLKKMYKFYNSRSHFVMQQYIQTYRSFTRLLTEPVRLTSVTGKRFSLVRSGTILTGYWLPTFHNCSATNKLTNTPQLYFLNAVYINFYVFFCCFDFFF